MSNSSRPRGVPPKGTKTGLPPKLGAFQERNDSKEVDPTRGSKLSRVSLSTHAPSASSASQAVGNQRPPLPSHQPSSEDSFESRFHSTPEGSKGKIPIHPSAKALPAKGSLIGKRTIIGGKLKAERKRSQWPLLAFTSAILVAFVVVPFWLLRPQDRIFVLRQYTAATVMEATIEETISSSGTVVPKDLVDIHSTVAATLQALLVKEGDDVLKGQVLAILASSELTRTARDAKNALENAKDQLAQMRLQIPQSERDAIARLDDARSEVSDLERSLAQTKELFQLGGESQLAVDVARSKLEVAKRELSRLAQLVNDAKALGRLKITASERAVKNAADELGRAANDLANLTIKAPFSGRVVGLYARIQQQVPASAKVISLADLSQLVVEGDVDDISAGRVQPGQAVRVTVGSQVVAGKVIRLASQAVSGVNGATVKVQVRLFPKLKAEEQGTMVASPIRPNSGAGLEITVGRKRGVLTLPRGAFVTTGGERVAFVIDEKGTTARRVDVTFGASNADRIEVTSGLSDGVRVITSSVEAFKDRATIEVSKGGELK